MRTVKRIVKHILFGANVFFSKIRSLFCKNKKVLLISYYAAYDEHVIKYYDCLEDKKNIKFYFIDRNNSKERRDLSFLGNRDIKVIRFRGTFLTYICRFWDLIVLPCHLLGNGDDVLYDYIPTLFIFHGTSSILTNGELFAYKKTSTLNSRGVCKYSLMLENNRILADELNKTKEFHNKIVFTGSASADLITDAIDKKEDYRKKIGIKPDEIVVFIYSTWNTESLFHVLGEEFLEKIKSVKSIGGKEVKFILSIHPKEYTDYSPVVKSMGKTVDSYACSHIIIRKPEDDWLPYLISSDIVIGDYSSMFDYSVLANKKIILSSVSNIVMSEYSIIKKGYESLPVIDKNSNIEEVLENVYNKPINENLKNIRMQIYTEKGFYGKVVSKVTEDLLYNKGIKNG